MSWTQLRSTLDSAGSELADGKIFVGHGVMIGENCQVLDGGVVRLGNDVIFGSDVKIWTSQENQVVIGVGTWVGDGVELKAGVSIGDGALVCGGSIVETDIPDHAVAEGRPAVVVWYLR